MRRRAAGVWMGCGVLAAVACAGPEWPESDDAGALPAGAQTPQGVGPLSKIIGRLEGPPGLPDLGNDGDFQDMYLIHIEEPSKFFASTVASDGGMSAFESHLWLFSADETGLLGTIAFPLDPVGVRLPGESNDGTGAAVVEAGLYYLAISSAGGVPLAGADAIFQHADPFEISGPDGPGGLGVVTGWNPATQFGDYEIVLGGVIFAASDCPADLTGDGTLDFFDVQAFLQAFSQQDPVADWNDDGVFDFFDALGFLGDFAAGCP